MRKVVVPLAVAVAAAAVAIPALAATRTVTIGDNYFVRASGVPTVTVRSGTTVRWVNKGDVAHDVRVSSGPQRFRSRTLSSGRSYTRRVTRKGTYRIFCSIHGARDQSMRLKVT